MLIRTFFPLSFDIRIFSLKSLMILPHDNHPLVTALVSWKPYYIHSNPSPRNFSTCLTVSALVYNTFVGQLAAWHLYALLAVSIVSDESQGVLQRFFVGMFSFAVPRASFIDAKVSIRCSAMHLRRPSTSWQNYRRIHVKSNTAKRNGFFVVFIVLMITNTVSFRSCFLNIRGLLLINTWSIWVLTLSPGLIHVYRRTYKALSVSKLYSIQM